MERDKLGKFVRGSPSWNKGVPCESKTKEKLSKTYKDKYKQGYINPFKGKNHSEKIKKIISKRTKEAMEDFIIKKKISLTHKGKHRSPKTEFKKGQHRLEEWNKKLSIKFNGKGNPFYGKKHNDITKEKLSYMFSGSKNHFWKGGISSENKTLRRSLKFRKWREDVFERDNYVCQICGFFSGQGKHIDLHPHHIKPFSDFPDLRFDVKNGVTLCRNCHMNLHSNKFAEKQEVKNAKFKWKGSK